jgi:hypothetical protein
MLHDGVVGGNHRHRDDHQQGRFQVVEFHGAQSISPRPVLIEILASEGAPGRWLRSSANA